MSIDLSWRLLLQPIPSDPDEYSIWWAKGYGDSRYIIRNSEAEGEYVLLHICGMHNTWHETRMASSKTAEYLRPVAVVHFLEERKNEI
jgi:hypothetical protein